jgi:tetratricopeptide (TPR) repeat protein
MRKRITHKGAGELFPVNWLRKISIYLCQRAIEIDPGNSLGQFALGMTYFSMGDIERAHSYMDRALALNPTDTTILGGYGVNLVLTGNIDRGLQLVDEVRRLSASPPNWIYNAYSAAHYLQGQYEQTLKTAERRGPTFDTQIWVYRTAALGMLGRTELAAQSLAELLEEDPGFRKDPQSELVRYFHVLPTIERVREGLERAGLDFSETGGSLDHDA